MKSVASFVIVVCGKCGGLLAAKVEQKTRTCPYCGSKIFLEKSKHVAVANDAREASATLKMLKTKAAEKQKR